MLSDTSLLDLTCSDGDSGNNAIFTIASIGGDDTVTKFKMDGLQLQTDENGIDYESGEMYTLTIMAVDTPDEGAPMTGTAVVKVTVKPENEFDPAWSSPAIDGSGNFDGVTIDEDTTSGTVVVSLAATDDDDGTDGDLSYSIATVTAGTYIW